MLPDPNTVPTTDGASYARWGLGVAGVAGAVLLDGGASSASPFISRAMRGAPAAPPMPPPGLLAAAKKEGTLNLIADPYNWANYGTQSTPNTVSGQRTKKRINEKGRYFRI